MTTLWQALPPLLAILVAPFVGSFLGTIVNGVEIGGRHSVAAAELKLGENDLVVGTVDSPFRFRVIVHRGPGPV